MCGRLLYLFVILAVISGTLSKKAHSKWDKKKFSFKDIVEDTADGGDIFSMMAMDDLEEEQITEEEAEIENPCASVHCGPGRECEEGVCVCVKGCTEEQDERRWVCSNHNQTYRSDCQMYRARCICEDEGEDCRVPSDKHMHIEYYGECKQMMQCEEDDLVDFPRRMREWLFSVMKDLAEREEISEYYQNLEKQAEEDQSKRWSSAAVWKWCDLDSHPHDNVVSRHELFPLRAPLLTLEHCLGPFLDHCDTDSDHVITIQEWAKCLDIEVEEITTACEQIDN